MAVFDKFHRLYSWHYYILTYDEEQLLFILIKYARLNNFSMLILFTVNVLMMHNIYIYKIYNVYIIYVHIYIYNIQCILW